MFKQLTTLVLIVLAASLSYAATESQDDSSDLGYDAIVDQLNREHAATSRARTPVVHDSSIDTVWMHGGLGFANYVQSIRFDDGSSTTLNQRGIQAALGIDLFSPNWMSEGTFRAFAEDGDSNVRSTVHEFELKLLYKDRIEASRFGFRTGVGLSGRYLSIKRKDMADQDYTTPMSVATLGGDLFVNDRISLGCDLNARNSLIGETIDHNSFDITLRVDTHF